MSTESNNNAKVRVTYGTVEDRMTELLKGNHDVYDRLRAAGLHDEAGHVWFLGAMAQMMLRDQDSTRLQTIDAPSVKAAHIHTDSSNLERLVAGALRSTVNAHGNVAEGSWIGSATKRIVNQLLALEVEDGRS